VTAVADLTRVAGPTRPEDEEPDSDHEVSGAPPASPAAAGPALWVGAFALLLYFGMVFYLLNNTGLPDNQWTRAIYLFSGIETIAFAAAGFLFGREVNRARAEAAEGRARVEAQRAAAAQRQATEATVKGKVLTRRISELADVPPGGSAAARTATYDAPAPDPLRQLADEARRFFPNA
jgi:hypothetical protein